MNINREEFRMHSIASAYETMQKTLPKAFKSSEDEKQKNRKGRKIIDQTEMQLTEDLAGDLAQKALENKEGGNESQAPLSP